MNKVMHFEIPADNVERAEKFYANLFDWKINKVPNMEYTIVQTVQTDEKGVPKEAGAINGGIMKRSLPSDTPVIVIDVPSLDEYLVKAQEMGSKVVLPKQQVGDMGLYARITDTEGNIIGLWQNIK